MRAGVFLFLKFVFNIARYDPNGLVLPKILREYVVVSILLCIGSRLNGEDDLRG